MCGVATECRTMLMVRPTEWGPRGSGVARPGV